MVGIWMGVDLLVYKDMLIGVLCVWLVDFVFVLNGDFEKMVCLIIVSVYEILVLRWIVLGIDLYNMIYKVFSECFVSFEV